MCVLITKASDDEWSEIEFTTEEGFFCLLQRLMERFGDELIVSFTPFCSPRYNLDPNVKAKVAIQITIHDGYVE